MALACYLLKKQKILTIATNKPQTNISPSGSEHLKADFPITAPAANPVLLEGRCVRERFLFKVVPYIPEVGYAGCSWVAFPLSCSCCCVDCLRCSLERCRHRWGSHTPRTDMVLLISRALIHSGSSSAQWARKSCFRATGDTSMKRLSAGVCRSSWYRSLASMVSVTRNIVL